MNGQTTTANDARLERALDILRRGLNAPETPARAAQAIVEAAPRGWDVAETDTPQTETHNLVGDGIAFWRLKSHRTGAEFTYKVAQADRGGWFVSLVNQPGDWGQYLGFIGDRDRQFRLTRQSRHAADAACVRAWAWTWERFADGRPVDGVEIERLEARQ